MADEMKRIFKLENDEILVSTKGLTMIFGVSSQAIVLWVQKGCPQLKRGWFKLTEVLDWRFATDNSPESLETQKQKADIRYREARADMEEIKHKTMVGEYIAVEDLKEELVGVFSQVKQTMLNIKQKVLQQLHSTYPECAFEVSEVVEIEVERGLKALAKGDKYGGTKQRKNNLKKSSG